MTDARDDSPSRDEKGRRNRLVSRTLQRHEHAIAEAVTDEFLTRHPDWVERYGEKARTAGIEDARFHLQFLSAAIESDSREAFRHYVQWTTRVLGARGIAPAFLWENLRQVEKDVGRHLAEEQRRVVADFLEFAEGPLASPAEEELAGPLAPARRMFVQAIVTGQRRAALNIALEALRGGALVQDVYADVFQAALYEVGVRWEANAITVAQEHMATAVTQYVMAHVFEHIAPPAESRGLALITGVPGELHHVGAMMVSDMLEAHGWQVQFLGSNLPIPSILSVIAEAKPQLLGVSVTMFFNLQQATQLIARAKAAAGGLRVVVGGAAFRSAVSWRDTGADDYAADVRSAIALLCG
jgi:methanogenic corrinoid protein MtbC1